MNYEKLHKDTINKLQQMINSGKITVETACGICADFVPENEDEVMIKFIKNQLFNIKKTITENYELDAKLTKAIDWLKKQGNLMKALQISNANIGELVEKNYYLEEQLEKQGKNNMGISEATKKKLEDNLNRALEKETPESWNKFLDEQDEQNLTNEVDNYDHKEVLQTIINEQKPIWSKKDICLLNNCISLIEDIDCTKEEQNWLKSLKDRIQPQPKQEWKQENTSNLTDFENAMMHIGDSFFGQHAGLNPNNTNAIKEQADILLELAPRQEWSEEDENNILFLTFIIEECFKDKEKITLYGDTVCANFTKEDVIDRLKSLKPQNTWKPSDEQMKALSAINVTGRISYVGQGQELINLYNDLKKLK